MAAAGPVGDRNQFSEYVQKNIHLHELRTEVSLDTKAAATWTRNQLAAALRKRPYQVNILMVRNTFLSLLSGKTVVVGSTPLRPATDTVIHTIPISHSSGWL